MIPGIEPMTVYSPSLFACPSLRGPPRDPLAQGFRDSQARQGAGRQGRAKESWRGAPGCQRQGGGGVAARDLASSLSDRVPTLGRMSLQGSTGIS